MDIEDIAEVDSGKEGQVEVRLFEIGWKGVWTYNQADEQL
jgi:hypothetical protein